jgi:cytochrome c oxidase subunit 3
MSQVKSAATAESVWHGGGSPYAIGSKKLGMWLFIISDALTFSALLIAYTYLRLATPNWPMPFHFSPSIIFSSVMTFCLLSSSLTMVMAVHAMSHGNRRSTVKWILGTMLGGTAFVVLHAMEWRNLMVHEHITPFSRWAFRCSEARSSP